MANDYTIVINDSEVFSEICGSNDQNIHLLEKYLGVSVFSKGNELSITDISPVVKERFQQIIDLLVSEKGIQSFIPVEDVIRAFFENVNQESEDKTFSINQEIKEFQETAIRIPHGFSPVFPKTLQQSKYIRALQHREMVFAIGPAGSGKTFLAIAEALRLVLSKKRKKLIITRPVVEAGESLGYLPGDLEQKISPYLRPLYDSMSDLIPLDTLRRMEESDMIEVAPLAYMRGRTLKNCVVILDEAQNTTREQMKMFLTRLGEHSSAFITGDITQTDLPFRVSSGLREAVDILSSIDEISVIKLQGRDVVRNPLVKKIIAAYEAANVLTKHTVKNIDET